MTPGADLVGREVELARVAEFLNSVREGPRALVVSGEAGIGKTALWREAVAHAQEAGLLVLTSRPAEAEMPIAHGAMADLLEPVFERVADALPEPQRDAVAAALGVARPAARPDRLAILRSFAAALRALAGGEPVLVAVDDAQWLDPASARALAFAVRRGEGQAVGYLVTLRGTGDAPAPLGLGDALGEGALTRIALGPLSSGALQHLVRRRIGVGLPRPKLAAVHAASGGNPMFALEFARAIAREPAHVRAQLPVPSSLQELVRDRVRALPRRTRPLLRLVAAAQRPTVSLLAKALDGTGGVEDLLGLATDAGAANVGRDGIVRFTHPLLASAIYFEAPASTRHALHRKLAEHVDDPEQRARHLALATVRPDEGTAAELERAASGAAARGAPDAAASLAAEAVRLTPTPDGDARIRRTLATAGYLLEAGDVPAARTLVAPLLAPGVPAAARTQALLVTADTEHADRSRLRALLHEAIELAADPAIRWRAWIRHAQHGGWVSGDADTAVASARQAVRLAEEVDDPALVAAARAALAYYRAGRGDPGVEPDDREPEPAVPLPRTAPWQITPAISTGSRLLWRGDLARAREVLHNEYDSLSRRGATLGLPLILLPALVDLEWRAGRWKAAENYAEEARTILEDALPGGAHVVLYARVLLAGSLGRSDEARALAVEGFRAAELHADHVAPLRVGWALGHVELARGTTDDALQALAPLPEALASFGLGEPGWQPILPDVAEALVGAGREEEAEAVVGRLETQASRLRHPWGGAAARRCRALLLLTRDAEAAATAAEESAEVFARLGFPLDRARALLVAGAARRRTGQRRRAAASLGGAIALLEALPAPAWLERAESELRRAAPRPRRDRDLTTAERRVAALVAEGRTNREVATQVFTTVATVEAHLTRIYRKLGVRSRTQLARAVAEGTLRLDD